MPGTSSAKTRFALLAGHDEPCQRIRDEQVASPYNTSLGCEPFSRYKRPTNGNFLAD